MKENELNLTLIPDSVRQDTKNFRTKLANFLSGKSSEAAFKAYRVPMGIYEHRKKGDYMARVRVPAGLITPSQIRTAARLSSEYGDGIVHITTRQDLQIHRLAIEVAADVLEQLLEAGLSTRGGGGNTVRNISVCPMSGICPNQKFDVRAHCIAMTEYMLQSSDSFNLPRKYKIAFSGCAYDCAFASVADLGFFAHNKDGVEGFSVYGAGGMGLNPAVAIKLEEFVPEGEIFDVAQAVKEIFDKYGDRSNKHKARLRYVLSRLGEKKFIEIYKQKRQEITNRSNRQYPQIRKFVNQVKIDSYSQFCELPANVFKQNTEGLFTVKLSLKLGNIPSDDLNKVADIAERLSFGFIRLTQSQDILITSVAADKLQEVLESISRLGTDVSGREKANIVTCTGADTCQLGLCLAKGLASAISDKIRSLPIPKEVIRISGCPNSCGQHYIAPIGFQGRAKRHNDKLMPCYELLLGGKTEEGGAKFGKVEAVLPAKDVPDFVYDVFVQNAAQTDDIKRIAEKYSDFSRDFSDGYFYDFGAKEPFSLKGRGPGECGAGVLDVIKMDIDEAKRLIASSDNIDDESLYKAVIFASRSLLILYGSEPQKDREVLKLFKANLIDSGFVSKQREPLLEAVIDWKLGDIESLSDKLTEIKEFVNRIEQLFLSLDSSLKFQINPEEQTAKPEEQAGGKSHIVDLRGVVCPLNFVKAKLELEKVQVGESISILLDEGEPIKNVPASFTSHGQEVLKIAKQNGHYIVDVRRNK